MALLQKPIATGELLNGTIVEIVSVTGFIVDYKYSKLEPFELDGMKYRDFVQYKGRCGIMNFREINFCDGSKFIPSELNTCNN